ncbi:MAG: putative 4-mercaptohistidine N1-methyltransferase [Lentimonas sp.]
MPTNPYESDDLLQQYLVFHYATAEAQFPYPFGGADALDFPKRCALDGPDIAKIPTGARALDLGCSVGRSSFELARHCEEVIGIDYSHAFIDAANRLQQGGSHLATRLDEGSASTELQVSVDPSIDRSRVSFEQGDAQNIRADIGLFDVVIACNLICRLPEPMKLIDRLIELVEPGGQLFVTTPFTWLEEYTPSENWLGDGAQDSFAGLRSALEPRFQLEKRWDMPFLIREHARKFQYSVAQASRWTRS